MTRKKYQIQNRDGFTLLELLMVVAIITFLMGLSVVAMNGITVQAEEEATKVTVLKVSRLLEQRIEAFERSFKGTKRDGYIAATVGLLKAVDGRFDYFTKHPDEAPPAIRLLAYKAAFRFEMPQRMVELNVGGGATPAAAGLTAAVTDATTGLPNVIYRRLAFPTAKTQLVDEGNATPTTVQINTRVSENWAKHQDYETQAQTSDLDTTHSTESSELLYFMLLHSGTLGSSTAAEDEFIASEIADTDQDGLPEFVDVWGNPLQFYRWPTRLFDPTAPNPFTPVFSNPNDATEVDPTPDDNESDGLREILKFERELAGLLVKGLPPSPSAIGGATQRDMMLVDPDDPVGILYTFIEDPQYINMGITLTSFYNEAAFHTPDTYHVPLIVSAGVDELLGLREPNNTVPASGIYGNLGQYAGTFAPGSGTSLPAVGGPVFEALLDNITNRNRRAGARR
ncbi:MAG: type II secretion system protein [Fuerstiella sp.]